MIDPEHDQGYCVEPPASPQDHLVRNLEGKAESGLKVVGIRGPKATVDGGGVPQSAPHLESADRDLWDRVGRVGSLGGPSNRALRRKVESARIAIVALVRCSLVLVAEPEVERQPRRDFPVVMNEEARVEGLVRAGGIAVDQAPRRLPEEHRSKALPHCGPCRVVERSTGEIVGKVVAASGVARTISILPI